MTNLLRVKPADTCNYLAIDLVKTAIIQIKIRGSQIHVSDFNNIKV